MCIFTYIMCYFRRVTAIGCECGLVKVTIVNVVDLQIFQSWLLRYDQPVSNVTVFPHQNAIFKPAFVDTNRKYFNMFLYDIFCIWGRHLPFLTVRGASELEDMPTAHDVGLHIYKYR